MIGVKCEPLDGLKGRFFNAGAVMRSLSEAQRRVLSRFGAYVRTRARTSIKPAKLLNRKEVKAGIKKGLARGVRKIYQPSMPGQPPRSRRGELRKHIYFAYDASDRDVVIGPSLVRSQETGTPARLEKGGVATVKRRGPKGNRVSFYVGNPPKKVWVQVGSKVKTKARPYMKPAFDKEMSLRMPAMFKDSMPAGLATAALSGSIA